MLKLLCGGMCDYPMINLEFYSPLNIYIYQLEQSDVK